MLTADRSRALGQDAVVHCIEVDIQLVGSEAILRQGDIEDVDRLGSRAKEPLGDASPLIAHLVEDVPPL